MNARDQFVRDIRSKIDSGPDWIRTIRKAALERFASMESPDTNQEEWRFTNIASVLQTPFSSVGAPPELSLEQIEPFLFHPLWPRLVFINGVYNSGLSFLHGLAEGIRISTIEEAADHPEIWEPYLRTLPGKNAGIFAWLNRAFLRDGAVIKIPSGVYSEVPLHLIHISTELEDQSYHPFHLIIVGKGSGCSLIESHLGLGPGRYLLNAVTEVVLEEGAVAEHYKIQQEAEAAFHLFHLSVTQDRDSSYSSFVATLGGAISRKDLQVTMDGTGSTCTLNGLYLMGGNQFADHHTVIEHLKPHGSSRETYKGILAGASRAVFNGKIVVGKEAQKTDARQSNKNLLLSDRARINTKPQLEILADDVKCSHGAAIGHLDDDALFYLRSRGIGESLARTLLMFGFVQEVSGEIRRAPLREKIEFILQQRLEQFAVATGAS